MGFRPRQPLFEAAICAAAGIALADRFSADATLFWPYAAALAAGASGLAWWLKRQDAVRSGRRLKGSGVSSTRCAFWLAVAALFCFWHSVRQAESPGRLLAARIPPGGAVIHAVGIVDEEPRANAGFRVRLESAVLQGSNETGEIAGAASARVIVHWPKAPPTPRYGDRLAFTGSARNFSVPRNPGEFDTPATRRRQGVWSEVRVRYPKDAELLGHGLGNPLIAASLRLRHWMERTMTRDIDDSPEAASVITSMVLGARSESLRETQRLFAYTGTLHLFAVSGMNVAMLAASAAWLLQALRVPRRRVALVLIPMLWAYCFVTGLTASSLRATIMASVGLIGIAIDRPALSWNTLGASALAILAWDPNQLFKPGFQLSFLLVAVLVAAVKPVQARFRHFGQPDPFLPRLLWSRAVAARSWVAGHAVGAFSISLVAWLGSIPLTAFYFHLWSPSTVPANLVAGALAWIMLMLGLGSAIAGTCWQWLSITLNNANWLFSKTLLGAMAALAAVPGSHFYVENPAFRRAPLCELEILDLAGGGAIHLRLRPKGGAQRDWLIDCASAYAFDWTLSPYLRSRGIDALDGLILTHGDSQHLGGAFGLLEAMPVGEVIDSSYRDRSPLRRNVHSLLAVPAAAPARSKEPQGKSIVWRGDRLTLAPGITVRVLYPPGGIHPRTADDKTLVLRLEVETGEAGGGKGVVRLLLMSDAGFITERWLLEHLPPKELECEIVVKGMHAADLSGTPEFLRAARPRLLVTSGADFPPAQRVDEAWAAGVEAQGIRLLRQDRTGAVRIAIDAGGGWTAHGFADGSFFRSSAR